MTFSRPLSRRSYVWSQLSNEPSVWQRPALAGECMWIPRPKELHEIFICSSLTLSSPIARRTFNARVRHAWRLLRFRVPELGVSTTYGTDGNFLMQYHTPTDNEANEWVDRTHSYENGVHEHDFEALRKTVLAAKQGHVSDNAFLLSRAVVENGAEELVKHSQIMIYVDHLISDGIGTRIIFGNFLTLLASSLGTAPHALETKIEWEESHHNLSPPWICSMNENQILSGPEYEATAASNRDIILNQLKLNTAFPLLQTHQSATQETHFITLTSDKTTALLQAIRQVIGPNSNITHLGHAAMVIALLRRVPTSSRTLCSPCWLNGRRYLRSELGAVKSYVPICQSFAPVVFSGLQELVLSYKPEKGEVRDVLVKACRVATGEYEKIRERKSMLPGCVVLFEELGKGMAAKHKELSSEQSRNDSFQEGTELNVHPQTAEPFFLSDGITEQYITHSYPSLSPLSPNPNPIFTVDDIQFAASAEKNLIVRMSSWRGRTTISGEWRGCDFEREMIVRFLEDVVEIMLSIVDG